MIYKKINKFKLTKKMIKQNKMQWKIKYNRNINKKRKQSKKKT